jgi:hypothetical protein
MFKEEPVVEALIKGTGTCSPKDPASVLGTRAFALQGNTSSEPRHQDRSLYPFADNFYHDFLKEYNFKIKI